MTNSSDTPVASTPVPAVVIGGWLGAGKTTLVNHLLRHAGGQRLAVLVNDFGELVIDADLIDGSAADGEVLALAGGCICCSFGADLLSALQQVLRRDPRPDRVLIEASGVGLPAAIARTARLAQGLQLEGIVVLADASTLRERLRDPYVGDTVQQQLLDADLLLLTQVDRVTPEALAALEGWLDSEGQAAPRLRVVQGQVAPELVLGVHALERGFDATRWAATDGGAAPSFTSASREFTQPVDLAALAAALAAPGAQLLRAKGVLTGQDGRRHLLQGVGRRIEVRPLQRGEPAPATDRLLLIGLGDLDRLFPQPA